MQDAVAVFIGSTLRLAIPLMFAATGELVSESAGVLNLSLEGMILTAASFAALASWSTGVAIVGLLVGVVAAVLLGVVQGTLSVYLRANQLVVGIGFNILALGATTLLYRLIFGGLSRDLIPGLADLELRPLAAIPVLGPALFQQSPLLWVELFFGGLVWWLLRHTALGLAVRAVGEHPRIADQAGISVNRIRFLGVLFASGMAGFGGAFLSIADIHTFTENMTNGMGYLAITAVIVGNWEIARSLAACLLFGAATALQYQLPAMGLEVPVAALLMLPYVLALLAVGGLVGQSDLQRA